MADERPDEPSRSRQRLPTWAVIRRMFGYYRNRRAGIAAVIALHVIVMGADLAGPRILGWLTDALREGLDGTGGGMAAIWPLFWLFVASVAVKNVFRFFRGWINVRIGMDIVMELRRQLHGKYLELDFRFHDDASSGELIALTTRDTDKVSLVYFDILISGAEAALMSVGVIGITMWISRPLGLIVLALFLLTLAAIVGYARLLPAFWRRAADSYDHVTEAVQENVAGVRVVKAFAREEAEIGKFSGRVGDYRDKEISAGMFLFSRMPLANAIFHAAVPLAFIVGGKLVLSGALSYGDLVAVVLYLFFFTHRLRMFGRIVETMQEAVASADRIFKVLDDATVLPAAEPPRSLAPKESAGAEVVFDRVSFGYGEGEPVLKDLSVRIEPGRTLGLLGRTGSGKSTLGALIPRYYDVSSGKVLLDGEDVRGLDPVQLRRAVTVVFQDTFLFATSIGENIRLGRPDAGEEEMVEAARAAQIHGFVSGLKDGYGTIVGERGVSLSGGQKQRAAIARALLMRPRVLILDDATSSVDSRTESALHRALLDRKRMTTVVISQRISSVMQADRIVVIERGRVAQDGTHEELSQSPGLYREMYESQMLERTDAV